MRLLPQGCRNVLKSPRFAISLSCEPMSQTLLKIFSISSRWISSSV
jgi:hypothetical protein